jgi:arylsulfatase A-like enzyme
MQNDRPNIVVILVDDLGYADLGCYGGEIRTPRLDRLAQGGVRMSAFHNSPRCSPSRASLLTGLHPHQTGIGILTNDDGPTAYRGNLNDRCVTAAEVLKSVGYTTAIRGKWHLAHDIKNPNDAWPTARGFDTFFGTLTGCGSYYQPGTLTRETESAAHEALDPDFFYTDAIADEAVAFLSDHAAHGRPAPFFLYLPFTAPHWPLHARPETIASYAGVYEDGWDVIRERRLARQKEIGLLPANTRLSERDPAVLAWNDEPQKEWQVSRMQVYAAMVEELDRAIGRVIAQLEAQGDLAHTLLMFLSDNGAAAEPVPLIDLEQFRERRDILNHRTKDGRLVRIGNDPTVTPGGEDTYASYGRSWANVSNTPFRLFKIWAHEGGVSAPFIVHWPAGDLQVGQIVPQAYQLVHILPTLLEVTGAAYPDERDGVPVHPLPAVSMLSAWRGQDSPQQPLFWEHCGNAALQEGRWKLVRQHDWPWELYDISTDRTESHDLAGDYPEIVQQMAARWEQTAEAVGVIPFRRTLEIYHRRGVDYRHAIG